MHDFLNRGRTCLGLQVADPDGDRDADVIAACSDGVETYRNGIDSGEGRTLRPRGAVSDGSGYGARIEASGTETRVWRGTGQPFMAGEGAPNRRAPAGTTIRVTWPSGLVQQGTADAAPMMNLDELRVNEWSRGKVAPADKVSVALHPERAGAADGDVTLHGASWRVPLAKGADGVIRGVIATPNPLGSAGLSVRIGKRVLKVRPRTVVR